MTGSIIIALLFILLPSAVIFLCRRVKVLGTVGPILILYILGIVAGNVFHPAGMAQVQEILSSATVPLAIPLLLFSCVIDRKSLRGNTLALLTGLIAVVVSVVAGWLIFARHLPEGTKVAAMLSGVYTGGTVNLAAIKQMLGVSEETFVLVNSCDIIVCGLYIVFLMTVGIPLFRRFLRRGDAASGGPCASAVSDEGASSVDTASSEDFRGIFTSRGLKDAAVLLGIDLLIVGISAGAGLLAGDKWFMCVLILMLTTLSLAAAQLKPVQTRRYGNEMGLYLIYIFSITVASMADLSRFDMSGSLMMFGYITFVIFGSLLLQLLLSKIFRVDADVTIAASVAYICSPPFVPMITTAMKNRRALVPGLTIGIVGYAMGTYLGYLLYNLLSLF